MRLNSKPDPVRFGEGANEGKVQLLETLTPVFTCKNYKYSLLPEKSIYSHVLSCMNLDEVEFGSDTSKTQPR